MGLSRPYRPALAGAGGVAAARSLVTLAEPWPLTVAIDNAIDGRPFTGLLGPLSTVRPGTVVVLAALTSVLLALLGGWLDFLATRSSERTAEKMGADLRSATFTHAIGLSLRYHDRARSGELVSRLTTDVGRVLDAVVAASTTLLPDTVLLVGVLVVLLAIDPTLAGVALLVVPVLAALAVRQRREVRAAQRVARAEAGHLAAVSTDLLRNVRAIQAFGRRRLAATTFEARNKAVRDAQSHAVSVEAGWTPRADVVLACGVGATFLVGAQQVLSGALSTGTLLVVLAYTRDLYSPVRALARMAGTFAKAGAALARVREVLESRDSIPDDPAGIARPTVRHGLRLHRVSFGYRPGQPVLHDLDLWVPAGHTVALVGPSGVGKSTLLHLILRLHDVHGGAITLDGLDVRSFRLAGLRRAIGFVPQDPWLLDGTIAQNIAFGAPGVTRAAVLRAGRAARVDEFALALPAGYDSPVGEGGNLLSGGQRRRVAVARALAVDAPLLLLDEPTASLDRGSATAVLDAVRAAAVHRTTLIVTHDPDVWAVADRTVTLPAPGGTGVVVEVGRPGPVPNRPAKEVNHA